MGTDIHIHIEYLRRKKSKKPHWIHPGEEFDADRRYSVFGILAGLRSDIKPLYPPRGLPGDITMETYRHYKDYGGEAHIASWLTTQEFGECLDVVERIVEERSKQPKTDLQCNIELVEKLLRNYHDDNDDDWLKSYRLLYKYMKDSDDDGEPARIIFWFDN